ncbi:MAG: MATE family efflux transporter [Clostridia bacterium]|nr:MATE family efflux transporter [Clostridia bacterium]
MYSETDREYRLGALIPRILRFTAPLMLTGILQLLYNAADSIVVGNTEGPHALAAVTSVNALINLILNAFMGFAVGTAVCVAHDYGAKDYEGVHRDIHTSILISIAAGIFVGAFGFIFSGTFLQWMGSPEDVIDLSEIYLKIYFLGTPANMVYNFGASVLRSLGETKRPLFYLAGAGALNVILNLILVLVFHLGVIGVAVGTIVAQYISAVLVIGYLIKRKDFAHFDFRKLRIYGEKLKKIFLVGFPAGLQGIAFSISNVMIQSSVNTFGSYAVAGNGAAASIEGFTYVSMNSVHHAALTFIGQNVGAKRLDRVKKIFLTCLVTVTVLGLAFGLTSYLLGRPLLSLFMDKSAEGIGEATEYGMIRLAIIELTYFLCGIMDVLVGAQRGLGMSFIPMLNALIGTCLLRVVWILLVFGSVRTLESVYISYPISWIITSAAHLIFFFIRLKKMRKAMDSPVRQDSGTIAGG